MIVSFVSRSLKGISNCWISEDDVDKAGLLVKKGILPEFFKEFRDFHMFRSFHIRFLVSPGAVRFL